MSQLHNARRVLPKAPDALRLEGVSPPSQHKLSHKRGIGGDRRLVWFHLIEVELERRTVGGPERSHAVMVRVAPGLPQVQPRANLARF